jgi:hypothetical protein
MIVLTPLNRPRRPDTTRRHPPQLTRNYSGRILYDRRVHSKFFGAAGVAILCRSTSCPHAVITLDGLGSNSAMTAGQRATL